MKRAALYARVSTSEQTTENQLAALRTFATARGWHVMGFVDPGVSGAWERRPALDALLAAACARRLDLVVCTKLTASRAPHTTSSRWRKNWKHSAWISSY
jgi:DNA invertase Pin-like site-specific DNA recombinase